MATSINNFNDNCFIKNFDSTFFKSCFNDNCLYYKVLVLLLFFTVWQATCLMPNETAGLRLQPKKCSNYINFANHVKTEARV